MAKERATASFLRVDARAIKGTERRDSCSLDKIMATETCDCAGNVDANVYYHVHFLQSAILSQFVLTPPPTNGWDHCVPFRTNCEH